MTLQEVPSANLPSADEKSLHAVPHLLGWVPERRINAGHATMPHWGAPASRRPCPSCDLHANSVHLTSVLPENISLLCIFTPLPSPHPTPCYLPTYHTHTHYLPAQTKRKHVLTYFPLSLP